MLDETPTLVVTSFQLFTFCSFSNMWVAEEPSTEGAEQPQVHNNSSCEAPFNSVSSCMCVCVRGSWLHPHIVKFNQGFKLHPFSRFTKSANGISMIHWGRAETKIYCKLRSPSSWDFFQRLDAVLALFLFTWAIWILRGTFADPSIGNSNTWNSAQCVMFRDVQTPSPLHTHFFWFTHHLFCCLAWLPKMHFSSCVPSKETSWLLQRVRCGVHIWNVPWEG